MRRNAKKLAELRGLQSRADALRTELGCSRRGEVTFFAPRDGIGDDIVVVEADGLGGATTSVVEGNYPVDYVIKLEKSFSSEQEAEAEAAEIAFTGARPSKVLFPVT